MSVVNFNDTTPAAAGGFSNVHWQSDASGNISANISPVQTITAITADYTVTLNDTFVVAQGAVNNITLPASPTSWQTISIRNASSPQVTINILGNGKTVVGFASLPIYFGATISFYFDPGVNNWKYANYGASTWNNWSPVATAQGSMTVSAFTASDAQWQWTNPNTISFKLTASFTLGGTASTQVYFTAPVVVVGTLYPQVCWVQQPSDSTPDVQYYFRPDLSLGFLMRTPTAVNFALGAYSIATSGWYRIQ